MPLTGLQYQSMRLKFRGLLSTPYQYCSEVELDSFISQAAIDAAGSVTAEQKSQADTLLALHLTSPLYTPAAADVQTFLVQAQAAAPVIVSALAPNRYAQLKQIFTGALSVAGVRSEAQMLGYVAGYLSVSAAQYASLLPGAYEVLQSDFGFTYGVTPKSSGTSPPVATLSGTLTKDGAVPLWFKCTTGGAVGSGAVFAAYVDGVGTTPIMTGIAPAAGAPVAITGSAALSGISVAWAAGTANVDNVWKATGGSTWNDQTANGKNAVQATVTRQPIVTIGLNGKSGLLFDGVDDLLQSTVGSVLALPYKVLVVGRAVSSKPAANSLVGGGPFNEGVIFESSAGNWSQYNQFSVNATPFGAFTNQLWIGRFSASTTDYLKIGALAATTGGNAGGVGIQDTNRQIGANNTGQYAHAEIFCVAYVPDTTSLTAFMAALNTTAGYGVGSIGA